MRQKLQQEHTQERERIREQKPRLGVDSLGDVDELGKKIVDAVDVQFYHHNVESRIHEVYVCGSFAEGTATANFSDLDVRVVIDPAPAPINVEDVERALRVDVGPEISRTCAGISTPVSEPSDRARRHRACASGRATAAQNPSTRINPSNGTNA